MNIVLVEPQIPQNTGNIARLCACTGAKLFLVGKMGFILSDKKMKRAGLDYWDDVFIKHYENIEELMDEFNENNFYFISTKAKKTHFEAKFKKGDFLVFGSETAGLPRELIESNLDTSLLIPMAEGKRSLNLSNSASIVLYEAIRQVGL